MIIKSYRQKLKLLPLLFVISLLVIYRIAIRDTISLKEDCNHLREEAKLADEAPKLTALIQKKLDTITAIAGKDTLNSETDPLLEFISNYTNRQIKLVDYQPVHIFQYQRYNVETRIAVLEGGYTNLLKLMFNLEKKFQTGKIISVKFETETNQKTEHKRLLMTLYVQSVKNNDTLSYNKQLSDNH